MYTLVRPCQPFKFERVATFEFSKTSMLISNHCSVLRGEGKMDRYSYDENYLLEDCNATHVCNHPHLEKGQKGWCIGKNGHKGIHRCGRCASVFMPKETYTREEILHVLNERIARYEKQVMMYPSKRRTFGYKIDELCTILTLFL